MLAREILKTMIFLSRILFAKEEKSVNKKLCRLITNHSTFKTIPIIMVTGNTGLIDRAKAKVAGSTDYMTKPFTQSELLKMVFK